MKIGTWQAGPSGERDTNGNLLPGENFSIERTGRRIKQGGKGRTWSCSCPRGGNYPDELCRHLRRIIDFAKRGEIPPQLKLTAKGAEAAGRCGCIKAAKAGKAPPRHKHSWMAPKTKATAAPAPHPRSWIHRKP